MVLNSHMAPRFPSSLVDGFQVFGEDEVVKDDILAHRPEFESDGADGRQSLDRVRLLEVVGVLDLLRFPNALTNWKHRVVRQNGLVQLYSLMRKTSHL